METKPATIRGSNENGAAIAVAFQTCATTIDSRAVAGMQTPTGGAD